MEDLNSNTEEINGEAQNSLRPYVKTILLFGIPGLLVLSVLIYFLAIRPSFSDRQAQIFCDCTLKFQNLIHKI